MFKRTKVTEWEYELLINIFSNLSVQYETFKNQLKEGLLNRVFFGSSAIPNYVGFTYFPELSLKYEDKKGRFFKLEGIKVWDKIQKKYIGFDIYLTKGMIMGYSVPETGKFELEVNKIDLSECKRINFDNLDFDEISKKLTLEERNMLNPSEVYKIILDHKDYYHIRDLEDGDFIGIDNGKRVYKITHDPFEITLLDISIEDSLKLVV